ncbi:MAG: FAD-dependent oxidoreductase [Peptococcaceae bacterium]|nr:FAD-dependent oxidoreductase [Peptococcaceae bacterium]
MDVKDAIVIGAGGAGIAAALTLAEGGAKVAIFEKALHAGGSMVWAEGTFAAESEMQRRRNIKESRDEIFRGMMEYSHWKANAALVRAFVDKSASTIDWLEQHGVEFSEPSAVWPGGPRTWHLFKKGYGGAVMKALVSRATQQGAEIYYGSNVKKILREPDGPVTGVVLEDETGKETKVAAKAVIIATGGYANNKEWIKKYTGFDLHVNLFPLGNFNKDGDGIKMAWEIGAAEDNIGLIQFNFGTPPHTRPNSHILGAVGQPTLWINQRGVRFCDEAIVQNFSYCGNAMSKQPGGYAYRIFDETTKRDWVENGVDVGVGMFYVPPRTRLKKLDAEIQEALEKNNPYIFVAESLSELADKIGIDRAILAKTVQEYNGYCAKGHDDQFAKDREFLRPVEVPKFYAFKCYTDFLGTLGGIKINEKTEVLDKNNEVIPGLYAAGNDAAGLYGDSYDVISSGATSAFAFNSGRMAGENALKLIHQFIISC